jgi:hypothetical protein
MAYKFQMGHADMSGSLTQLGGMIVSGTLSASAAISGPSLTVDADVTAGADVILSQNGNVFLAGDGGAAKIVSTGANAVSIFGSKVVTNGASIEPDSNGGTTLGTATKMFDTSFQSGLASLDGGINVLDLATISAAGVLSGSAATATYMTASAHVSASYFFGDGAGLTNVSSDSVDVADSSAPTEFRLVGVAASGDGVTLTTMDTAADRITMNAQTGKLTVTGDVSAAGLTLSDLTSGRLPLVSTSGLLSDDSQIIYNTARSLNGYNSIAVSSSASGSAYLGDGLLYVTDNASEDVLTVSAQSFDFGSNGGSEAAFSVGNIGGGAGDVSIYTDNASLYFGADQDVSLMHVPDIGLRLEDAMGLSFREGGININSDAPGYLDIGAGTEVRINSALSGSGALKLVGAADLKSSLAVGLASTLSGIVTMGSVDNVIPATAVDIAASDHLYFDDGANVKKVTMGGIGGYLAGGGLVADGDGVISLTAYAAPQGIGDANYTLVAGVNYGSASLTADRTWTLPSGPDIGDRVVVKAPGVMNGNQIVIQRAGAQFIDGGSTSVNHESALGAVELIYVASDDWRIV